MRVGPTEPARKKILLPSKNGDAAAMSTSLRMGRPADANAPSTPVSDSTSTSPSLSQSPKYALPNTPAATSCRRSSDPIHRSVFPSVDRWSVTATCVPEGDHRWSITRNPALRTCAGTGMSVRVPSRLMTPMPRSVTYATPFPAPVQRVPNGREVFAASVVSVRGWEPSRLEAQRTNAPEGLCRQ